MCSLEFIDETQKDVQSVQEKKYTNPKQDSERLRNLKAQLRELLQDIAGNGRMPEDVQWQKLKLVLLVLMKDACVVMNEKYSDITRTIDNNFEDLLKDLMDLLLSFDRE